MSDEEPTEKATPEAILFALGVVEQAKSDPRIVARLTIAQQDINMHLAICERCRKAMQVDHSFAEGIIPNRWALCDIGRRLMYAMGLIAMGK